MIGVVVKGTSGGSEYSASTCTKLHCVPPIMKRC